VAIYLAQWHRIIILIRKQMFQVFHRIALACSGKILGVSAFRVGEPRFGTERPISRRLSSGVMPLLHHNFRRFCDILDELNPAQIEDAQTMIRDLRRKTEAISEIEARANQEAKCPSCGDERRQKWGRTRTKIQRYRCSGCRKTYTGRSGSVIGRIHRPDLFMAALRDMLGTFTPQSVRRLALHLWLNKHTVWRWRVLAFSIIGKAPTAYC
jgi:transposase-like protein